MNPYKKLIKIIFIIAIHGLLIMLMWNNIIVKIFNIMKLNYWQSVGLWILCNCLFTDIDIDKL